MIGRSRFALVGAALVIVAVAVAGAVVASGDDPETTPAPAAAPATSQTTGARAPEVLGDVVEREPDDRDTPPASLPEEEDADGAGVHPPQVTPAPTTAAPPRALPATPPALPAIPPVPAPAPTTEPPAPPAASPVPVGVTVLGEEGTTVSVALTDPASVEPVDAQQGSVGEYALTAPGPGTWELVVSWTGTTLIDGGDGVVLGGGSLALKHVFEVSGPGPLRFVCSTGEGCLPA